MHGDAPALDTEAVPTRPVTRADCVDGPRPCPWVSCAHHALLGRLSLGNGLAPKDDDAAVALLDELPVSCVLDVTDAAPDGAALDAVGGVLGVTKERVRQMEVSAGGRAMARAHRSGLDGEVTEHYLDADPARPRRVRIAVPASEERRPTPAPPHLAHLPGPADVAPGDTFWCARIAGAVTTHLCGARRVAVTQKSAGTRPIPLYRECAGCPDGAALAERIAHAPPAPERRRLPVLQPPRLTETMMKTKTTETPVCDAKDCDSPRAGVRANTIATLAPFCLVHRKACYDRARTIGSVEAVAQGLRDGTLPAPDAARSAAGKRRGKKRLAKAAKATKAKPPKPAAERRPAAAPTDGLALVRRMAAAITRLGGIDAAEALADELATMGGAQ